MVYTVIILYYNSWPRTPFSLWLTFSQATPYSWPITIYFWLNTITLWSRTSVEFNFVKILMEKLLFIGLQTMYLLIEIIFGKILKPLYHSNLWNLIETPSSAQFVMSWEKSIFRTSDPNETWTFSFWILVNRYFGKQWRPIWNATQGSISSGSALFSKITNKRYTCVKLFVI